MTNWRKLDLPLADALGSAGAARLSVFVHFDPEAVDALAALGVDAGSAQGGIVTASLGAAQIAALSEQTFVHQIRLSTPLRMLDDQ